MKEKEKKIPVLHLNLTSKWYDLIEKGIKKEEYREQKTYWNRIFVNGRIKVKGVLYHPTDVVICFSNGYSKTRRQMYYSLKRVKPSFGKAEWGALPNTEYHTLVLNEHIMDITTFKL